MYSRQQVRGLEGGGSSPTGLRGEEDEDTIETYHPRILVQNKQQAGRGEDENKIKSEKETKSSRKPIRWLPRVSSLASSHQQRQQKLGLNRNIAKMTSLDSAHSSSVDGDLSELQPVSMAVIRQSEYLNQPPNLLQTYGNFRGSRNRRLNNRSYYRSNKSNHNDDQDEQEEEDDEEQEDEEDEFFDFNDEPILSIPYSSSSMAASKIVNRQDNYQDATGNDRQGYIEGSSTIKDNDDQFSVAKRASVGGSIISDIKSSLGGGSIKKGRGNKRGKKNSKKDKRRSKSPSSSSLSNINRSPRSRHSRRGLLGLASRLKLTRKHDSIAKFQLSILNSGFVSFKTIDRDMQTFLPKDRLTPKEFEERVKLMRKYEVLANIEYRFASRYETYYCKHALRESNEQKNTWKKCIPYDYNRVVLKTLPNIPDSDYINASHVDSCLKPNAYIAAAGPNEFTMDDFWRMVWEQKTFVIVMLTKVFDFIRVMCRQYWPVELDKPKRYGSIEATLLHEEHLADFVIRTIKLTKLSARQVAEAESKITNGYNFETSTAGSMINKDIETENSNLIEKTYEQEQEQQAQLDSDEYDDEEDEDDDDDENSSSDFDQTPVLNPRANSSLNLKQPSVREPKFAFPRRKLSRSPRGNVDDTDLIEENNTHNKSHLQSRKLRSCSQPPEARNNRQELTDLNQSTAETSSNIFLHPLSQASNLGFTLSASSLNTTSIPMSPTIGISPTTPVPRTPSSAVLDRSSVSRRPVKKKRRPKKIRNRQMRTHFQVPDDSQLVDDDDEIEEEFVEGTDGEVKQQPYRIIYQFHYNQWSTHTCPFASSLLHFRRRVRICMDELTKSAKTRSLGPTIVHCSDGCGRTGTYLAIDANLELVEEDNVYDVYNYTKKIRQARKYLIENIEQYKFVYSTIEEAMNSGKTWIPISELQTRLKFKSQRNPITKKNEYYLEYEKLRTQMTSKFSTGDRAGGHRVENRAKNRDVSTVPPDNFRPYLQSYQSNDHTDYINAVWVDGYTRSKEYIVTEWPMQKTIGDFWSCVYDYGCESVIVLQQSPQNTTYPPFFPSEKERERKYGPVFTLEFVSYEHFQNVKSWVFNINRKIILLHEIMDQSGSQSGKPKNHRKSCRVFQLTCWPESHRVPTSTNALVELMSIVDRWRQTTGYGPCCVVSLDGKSRAGVYCAVNYAIEQISQHNEVDIFQAVKTVRRHRPQLLGNLTEYKYCYDLILHYVSRNLALQRKNAWPE